MASTSTPSITIEDEEEDFVFNPFEDNGENDLAIYANGRLVNPESAYICDICRRVYKSQNGLENHKRNKHEVNVKRFHCLKCPKTFELSSSLFGHIKTAHDQDEKYVCGDCGKNFGGSQKLADHMKRDHKKVHRCLLCGKSFFKYVGVITHLKGVHHNIRVH